ncbi:flagellar biosynthesis protein FliQ [Microbacterium sp. ASV81]|uniref:Flagellar biosynthetic protein FliQ n=1 Tax=Microbacterium capsulatum TaxID=3041921 RepID=A0ABU0XDM4_9MICO|nr:flagellar biosynthesis protein FliQ [Microbacterium sp. ASV81]MDQ4213212.1 flagellar biosynthesis protein FliQ [Microbacterium sp. ASV81]
MNPDAVVEIGQAALVVGAKLCAPLLLTALVVGFAISLLQSITQVQEMTISFVPKLVAVGIALVVCGHWMIAELMSFTTDLFARIPALLSGG